MARQRYYHDPSRKHIEAYQDFSGGLNANSSNDNVSDNEVVVLENFNLSERGSLDKRHGIKEVVPSPDNENKPQGVFKYYRHYTPYNLLGLEGAFDGALKRTGNSIKVGNWYGFNVDYDQIFKSERADNPSLITNGDFENGETGWDLTYAGSRVISTASAYSGSNVLNLRRLSGDNNTYKNEYQIGYQDTQEGEEFYITAMYRKDPNLNAPTRVHIQASVWFGDTWVGSERLYTRSYDVDGTWKKIEAYVKMPKGAKRVYFGVGMKANAEGSGCYFDDFYARREIAGTSNGIVGIQSNIDDTTRWRGVGLKFDGLKPNAYYIMVADYRAENGGEARMAVRDERFGRYPQDNGLIFGKNFSESPTNWTTINMPFKTHNGMTKGRAYVYNHAPLNTSNAVSYFDNVRIYELTSDMYDQISSMTEQDIEETFPYRVGKLTNETYEETVRVVNGSFFVDDRQVKTEEGSSIQTERPVEAVNYRNSLYIATGSGLYVYNGSTISRVAPYQPTPLERLYVGSNALYENPFSVEDNDDDTTVNVRDIQFSRRYGVTNEFITVDVSVNKPGGTSVEYKFERRNVNDKRDYWFTLQDWSTNNSCTFVTDIAGEYQFKISVREQGTSNTLDEYTVPKYIIKTTEDESDRPIDSSTLDLCNRIMVHWDRIILYGDESKGDIVYVSDVFNPEYFPVNNTLQIENPRKESITDIVKFRDNLVIMTNSSITALFGTNPEEYKRIIINTDLGCIAPKSAKVVENYIIFPSFHGIAYLKSVGTSETRANVDIIDQDVKPLVENTDQSFAYVTDNQYCIVYPNSRKQLRYYHEYGVWAVDQSDSFDWVDGVIEENGVLALGSDGRLVQYDESSYEDEGKPFTAKVRTKYYFFRETYAIKKTKEIRIMVETGQVSSLNVKVELDTQEVITNEVMDLDPNEEVYNTRTPGKGLGVNVQLEHSANCSFKLNGLGFIFKLKRP